MEVYVLFVLYVVVFNYNFVHFIIKSQREPTREPTREPKVPVNPPLQKTYGFPNLSLDGTLGHHPEHKLLRERFGKP
jgi:hypothetical protein